MSKFKVGDKVVCVENGFAESALKKGENYTVEFVYNTDSIQLYGIGHIFFPERFELNNTPNIKQPTIIFDIL